MGDLVQGGFQAREVHDVVPGAIERGPKEGVHARIDSHVVYAALNAAGLTSRSTPNWVRDADGNMDDVFFCMDSTQVGQWAWAPKSQSGDNICFQTSNGAVTPVFNKWSASTGAQESGQNWMMERDWYFQ